jgi:prolyl oligopeptidase
MRFAKFLLIAAILIPAAAGLADDTDPYLWLEEIDGEKALEWVKERSATDTAELEAVPEYG